MECAEMLLNGIDGLECHKSRASSAERSGVKKSLFPIFFHAKGSYDVHVSLPKASHDGRNSLPWTPLDLHEMGVGRTEVFMFVY